MADDQPQEMPLTDDELGLALRISSLDCRTEAGNVFFNSFSYVRDLREHNYAACMTNGLRLLVKCKSLDEAGYLRIHKGSAYYWIAMAAFLSYNFEAAAYFFDAAVSEDLRAGRHPVTSSTPSFKFLLVQGDFSEQAAKNLVQELQRRLEFTINDYNSRPGRTPSHPTLSIEHLREDFILPALVPANSHLRSLPTALISFTLEWFHLNLLLDLRAGFGTAEPFMLHLFKGCVLFESILRSNPTRAIPPGAKTLLLVLQHIRDLLALPNNIPISSPDFATVLAALPSAGNTIQEAIIYTGRARNALGHSIAWPVQLSNQQYNKLVMMIFTSCFHAIANLYAP